MNEMNDFIETFRRIWGIFLKRKQSLEREFKTSIEVSSGISTFLIFKEASFTMQLQWIKTQLNLVFLHLFRESNLKRNSIDHWRKVLMRCFEKFPNIS